MKTSNKLNKLVKFATEHGGTLKNHREFIALYIELGQQILALEEIANEADVFVVDHRYKKSIKNEDMYLHRIERAIEQYKNPPSENQIIMNLIYPGDWNEAKSS